VGTPSRTRQSGAFLELGQGSQSPPLAENAQLRDAYAKNLMNKSFQSSLMTESPLLKSHQYRLRDSPNEFSLVEFHAGHDQ
jgi:hypothetical protein